MVQNSENPNHRFHKLLSTKSQPEICQLLQVKISSLNLFFHSDFEILKTLISAIENHSKSDSWELYSCPVCSKSFSGSLFLSQHLDDDHRSSTSFHSLKFLIPKRADSEKIELLVHEDSDLSGMNSERTDLVSRIQLSVRKLVEFKLFADTALNMMIKIAGVHDLGSMPVSKLKVIATFLEGLVLECCKSNTDIHIKGESNIDEVLVNADSSMLRVNKQLFSEDNSCVPNIDKIIAWLYDLNQLTSYTVLSNWEKLKYDKDVKCKEIYKQLLEEYEQLYTICVDKHNCLKYRSAVVTLEKVFMELVQKTNQSQEAVMRKLRGDLSDREGNDNDLLRYVAANVSKEAVSLKTSKMRNLVKLAKHDDTSMADAFRKQILDSNFEEAKHDTKILRKTMDIEQLQEKLVQTSALNSHEVVVPLVKIYLQRRLEDEAEFVTNASRAE